MTPPAQSSGARGSDAPVSVRWLGHAAFEIVSPKGTRLLLDPWISGNPSTPDQLKSVSYWTGDRAPAAILVSHVHFDHAQDVPDLAKASDAAVIGIFDYVSTLGLAEGKALGGNVGGQVRIGDATVHFVPAMHSSSVGRPLGYVIVFDDGKRIYYSGDTWIFSDMALIQEIHRPDVVMISAGGGPFTCDPATAALAVNRFFEPLKVVPMHFGTFGALAGEDQVRAAFGDDPRLVLMRPGETREV